MEGGAGAVDGIDSHAVCGRLRLRELTVVCLEEGVKAFVDACVTEVGFSEAADVIDDMVLEVEF